MGTPRGHPTWPSRKTTEPPWVSTLSRAGLGLIPENSLCSVISRENPAEETTWARQVWRWFVPKRRSQGGPTFITPCAGARGACSEPHTPLCALTPHIPMSTRYPVLSPETRHSSLSGSSGSTSLQNHRLCPLSVW